MKEIIITAVITSFLTIVSSYFLMSSQFTAEQEYWLNRQNHERLEITLDKKIKLLESFNEDFLKLDVLTSKMKMTSS
jgi:hypothetical protein